MGQVPRSKRFGLIKAALLHTMQTVFLCMLYYFFFSCFFWRCVNIYFYFFVRKCFQNSIWTFFFVHIFFKIIILDFLLRQNWVKWYTVHELMRQLNTNFWIFELILISRNESDEISWLKSPTPEITIESTPENETRPPQAPKRKSQNMASIIMIYQTSAHYPYQGLVYVR